MKRRYRISFLPSSRCACMDAWPPKIWKGRGQATSGDRREEEEEEEQLVFWRDTSTFLWIIN